MKVMIIGDVHLSDTPPSSCTDTYTEDLFDLLLSAREVAVQYEVEAVIQAGDMFHIKSPSKNSHKLVQRAIDVWSSFPLDAMVYVVPGNHDMSNNRFSSVFTTQPLGVLIRSGATHLLSGWNNHPTFKGQMVDEVWDNQSEDPDLPIFGIPWLAEWNHTEDDVRDQAVDEALEQLYQYWDGSTPVLIVTHAPFYPPGLELSFENYPTKRFSERVFSRVKGPVGVYYGHVHEAHGIYSAGGIRYANLGALSRGSLHEHNLKREVSVTIWDSDTNLFEVVPLPHKPASEVFRLQEAAVSKREKMDLDAFLAGVDPASIEIADISSVVHQARTSGLDPEVVERIEDLLMGTS